MTWLGWVLFAVYLIGYVMTLRYVVWMIGTDWGSWELNGEGIAMGLMMGGIFIAPFWPLVVPGYALWKRGGTNGCARLFVAVPKEYRLREREQKLCERELRIQRLESELDIS